MTKTFFSFAAALFFSLQLIAQTNHALSFNGHSPASGTDCSTTLPLAQRNYVQVPHSADLNLTGAFTIEFWVNVRKADGCTGSVYYTPDYFCPVSKSTWQGSSDWAVLIYPGANDGKINFYMGGVTLSSSLFPIETNTWYHVAISRDNAGTVNFYVNGKSMGSGSNTSNATSSSDMFIARNTTANYTYDLAGSLDELRLWNVARTAQQIQANMFSELNAYTGLIAYYKFNDNGSSTLTDATANGHNGILQQFASTVNATSNSSSSGWIYSTAPVANGYNGPGGVGATNGQGSLSWWLKADAGIQLNGSSVQTWQDQSGNANDVTQSTAAAQPVYQAANASLNNQSTINFNGSNAYMSFGGLTNAFTSYHSFYVFRTGNSFNTVDGFSGLHSHDNWSPGYVHSQIVASTGVWQHAVNNAPAYAESSTAFTSNNNYAVSLKSDATVQMRFFNGGTEGNTSAYVGNQYFGPGTLGAWNNAGTYERKANLQWGEIILFNKALNRAQENIIYDYLSAKYGISLTAGNYYNGISAYHHNLIGIGNANDGAHAVAKGGGLMLTNFGMLNDDGDYLLAAHDNGTGTTSMSGVSGVNYRFNRLWDITNTDAAGTSGGSIGISFDLGELGNVSTAGAASDYALLVSSDGFNFSAVSSLSTTIINNNTVQFILDASSIADGFYTVGALTSSALPLHLLSFTAQGVESKALLTWETSGEMDVARFEVEHSLQTNSFKQIGKIDAQNTTSSKYSFVQQQPNAGIHYYRLKMVDKNGGFTYSGIRALTFTTPSALQFFPSPFTENFTVKASEGEQIISMEMYDVAGKRVDLTMHSYGNRATITPLHAAAGLYSFKLVTTKTTYTEKIVRLK